VCNIVAHHHSAGFDTIEFRVIWDADNLVNTRDECSDDDLDEARRRLARILKTGGGKHLAERMFGVPPDEGVTEPCE